MGQVLGCCTVKEADDTTYSPTPESIIIGEVYPQEKITDEGKIIFLAVDPKFTVCKLRKFDGDNNLNLI